MRLGRFQTGSEAIFAVSESDDSWVTFPALGVQARDTREAINALAEASSLLGSANSQSLASLGTIVCPIVRPGKIMAIGLNYMDHIRETGAEAPDRPIVFAKYPSSLSDPYAAIEVDPQLTQQADYESELAVVIGRKTRRSSKAEALSNVFGYLVANDVSARDLQRKDSQLSRSKSFDTFCPMGPWITKSAQIDDPQNLRIRSTVNGEVRQNSSTSEMIFGVATLIEYLSQTMTLEVGDVILTGTPFGVGFAKEPPVFLKAEDVVRCEIETLGHIENRVVSPAR